MMTFDSLLGGRVQVCILQHKFVNLVQFLDDRNLVLKHEDELEEANAIVRNELECRVFLCVHGLHGNLAGGL